MLLLAKKELTLFTKISFAPYLICTPFIGCPVKGVHIILGDFYLLQSLLPH